jgi:hypothetical protein
MSEKIKTEIDLADGFFIIEQRKWYNSPNTFSIYKDRLYSDLTSATKDLLALETLNDNKEVIYFLQVASGRPLELTDEVKSNGKSDEEEIPF